MAAIYNLRSNDSTNKGDLPVPEHFPAVITPKDLPVLSIGCSVVFIVLLQRHRRVSNR